jgi:hypothetical protein
MTFSITTLDADYCYIECIYAKWHIFSCIAECHYAECRYAGCHTAPNFKTSKLVFLVKNWFHMNETRQGLIVKKRLTIGYTREVLLKWKTQYS